MFSQKYKKNALNFCQKYRKNTLNWCQKSLSKIQKCVNFFSKLEEEYFKFFLRIILNINVFTSQNLYNKRTQFLWIFDSF